MHSIKIECIFLNIYKNLICFLLDVTVAYRGECFFKFQRKYHDREGDREEIRYRLREVDCRYLIRLKQCRHNIDEGDE